MMKKNGSPAVGKKHLSQLDRALKIELVRKFQHLEGNYDCYATPYSRVCEQTACLWRNDCRFGEQGAV
jgi:hypothetical protein